MFNYQFLTPCLIIAPKSTITKALKSIRFGHKLSMSILDQYNVCLDHPGELLRTNQGFGYQTFKLIAFFDAPLGTIKTSVISNARIMEYSVWPNILSKCEIYPFLKRYGIPRAKIENVLALDLNHAETISKIIVIFWAS